jgi:hypothetical protein
VGLDEFYGVRTIGVNLRVEECLLERGNIHGQFFSILLIFQSGRLLCSVSIVR